MNKLEFVEKLKSELSDLQYSEVERVISYYSEIIDDKIDDNISEKKAVASLGEIDDIIKDIRNENSVTSVISNSVKNKYVNSSNKGLIVTLVILSSPIWIPIILTIVALIFSIYISLLAILFSLVLVFFAVFLSSIVTFVSGIYFMTNNIASGILMIGISFITLGMCILLYNPLILLIKGFFTKQKDVAMYIIKRFKKESGDINE